MQHPGTTTGLVHFPLDAAGLPNGTGAASGALKKRRRCGARALSRRSAEALFMHRRNPGFARNAAAWWSKREEAPKSRVGGIGHGVLRKKDKAAVSHGTWEVVRYLRLP